MSSDNIRDFLDKKSHEAVSHYSLTEIKKDELLIGTPDDTVLDPEFSKEFYLKSFLLNLVFVGLKYQIKNFFYHLPYLQ